MKIETVAIVLFAAWFFSEGLILRTARDRSGANVDHRSLAVLATSNMLLPWLSIALYFLGIGRLDVAPMFKFIGTLVMVAGFCVRWSGMWTLRKFFSANVAVQNDHRLVIAGPYRFVRHPGYFGGWLSFVGLGMALGNGLAIVLLTVFTLPAFLYRIRIEEDALTRAFPDYPQYVLKVKRFLPFVW
ncbi:methyltransferase family protein [Dyella japonica]|uniref:methyltransferase family protein n=1 Tax=Dyella japonica TaxID=231455 RepID=UPI000372E003|nr:isoprenylcysteine carboxylmethyltransferase family protein [Dyella japonica]